MAVVNLVSLLLPYYISVYIRVYKDYSTEFSHVISKDLDGGATQADGRASAPVGPGVATPLGRRKP